MVFIINKRKLFGAFICHVCLRLCLRLQRKRRHDQHPPHSGKKFCAECPSPSPYTTERWPSPTPLPSVIVPNTSVIAAQAPPDLKSWLGRLVDITLKFVFVLKTVAIISWKMCTTEQESPTKNASCNPQLLK